ncbi:MAG: hypothetical protein LBB82_05210 [Treponema sp.]|nr:hypothetical protein [Treponema sp.]
MKKVLLISIFITVVGAGLFAQEFKWDGYVNSGFGYVYTNEEDVDPYLTAFGVDSGQFGYRFRLNGSYTNADSSAGAKFRFQSQVGSNQVIGFPYVYGWIKPLDILTINGGLVDDGTWNSGGVINDDVGEGLGVLVKLSVAGLDAGVGAYMGSNGSGSGNNTLLMGNNNDINTDAPLKYTFALGYTMEDVFKITASVRNEGKTTGGIDSTVATQDPSLAIVGFRLLSVPKLGFVVEGRVTDLDDFSDTGKVDIFEAVSYAISDKLTIGLNAGQFLNQVEGSDIGIKVGPWVSYAIGKIVPRLDAMYYLAGAPALDVAGTKGKYNFLHADDAYKPNYDSELSVIAVRPSVKFNFDSKTALELGDIVNYEMGPDGKYNGGKSSSRLTNVFYVDFVWKF